MPQAKKKTATKTAKKTTAKKCAQRSTHAAAARHTQKVSNADRNHIYLITAMSIITAVLLCANIAMMTV